jgi:hypothetical protein
MSKRERDTSQRCFLALPEEMASALALYRTAKGHTTETAAVRALVKRGLEQLQAQNSTKARSLPIEPQ